MAVVASAVRLTRLSTEFMTARTLKLLRSGMPLAAMILPSFVVSATSHPTVGCFQPAGSLIPLTARMAWPGLLLLPPRHGYVMSFKMGSGSTWPLMTPWIMARPFSMATVLCTPMGHIPVVGLLVRLGQAGVVSSCGMGLPSGGPSGQCGAPC